jgi:hypothetical protein
VSKLDAAGSALVYSTYLGGSDFDSAAAIAVDKAGDAYVTGPTHSRDFPTTAGAFSTTYAGGNGDAFVSKLNAAGSALIYSTYLGSSGFPQTRPPGHRGGRGRRRLRHWLHRLTRLPDHGRRLPYIPSSSVRYYDAFVSKLDAAGSALLYSTYLGGSYDDTGQGIAVDGAGDAYVTGYTASSDFPTTAGALSTTYGGGYDAFVTKIHTSRETPAPSATPAPTEAPIPTDTPAPVPTSPASGGLFLRRTNGQFISEY